MSSEEKEILTDYLKELQKRIMKLQENEHYEVLKIIIKHNCSYSENKNGIFINMTKLSKQSIDDIENLLEFSEKNKIILHKDTLIRNNLIENLNKN